VCGIFKEFSAIIVSDKNNAVLMSCQEMHSLFLDSS